MLHHDNFQLPKEPQVLCDEYGSPLRLLFSSYGIAATVAVLVAFTGVGLWASLLVFWLGGAATVFALGFILARHKPVEARANQSKIEVFTRWIAFQTGR